MNSSSKQIGNRRFTLKLFSIIMTIIAILATLIGCSVNWSHPKWIFIAGSSTMQPLLNQFSKVYSAAEVSAIAGGSSYGINSVLANKKNIGSVSKSPSVKVAGLPGKNGTNSQDWEQDAMKTVTIAKDSIGIIYKDNNLPMPISINESNIAYFYLAFCGYNKISLDKLDSKFSSSKYLIPFARAGGSNESGTAESFLMDNGLGEYGKSEYLSTIDATQPTLTQTTDELESIYKVLSSGKYGTNVVQTNETSLETWEVVKSYKSPNDGIPITYLSSGFIKNNYQEITDNGFKVAQYSDKNIDLIINTNGNYEISEKYNWFRPLNLILKTKNTTNISETKAFIEWIIAGILFKNSEVDKIINDLGFVSLTPSQVSSMFDPNNLTSINNLIAYTKNYPDKSYKDFLANNEMNWDSLWLSDYELYSLQSDERDTSDEYYGAILRVGLENSK